MKAKKPARIKTTEERLLDTAERLFARQGIRATSLREITEQTRINIAAVNYHFRTKKALVRSVIERSFKPLNEERLRRLDEIEAAAGDGPPSIEAILGALFLPMLRSWKKNRNFVLLSGRLQNEPDADLHKFIIRLYAEVIERFQAATMRALPETPGPDLFFWMHYLFGGMIHTLLSIEDLERLPGRHSMLEDTDRFLAELVSFGAAGLRAIQKSAPLVPSPRPPKSGNDKPADVRRRTREAGV